MSDSVLRPRPRWVRTVGVLAVSVGAAVAGCGGDSSGSTSVNAPPTGGVTGAAPAATPVPVPVAVPSGLPFTFDGGGQGGSPPFTIPSDGMYNVAYHLSADANGAPCSMSIALSHGADSVPVVDQLAVAPGTPKDGTRSLKLASGAWRAIEGGGCAWRLTVSAP